MISIQEIHQFNNLCNSGLAKHFSCGQDSEHPYLVSGLDEKENVIFYCLACNYKLVPGEKTISKIKKIIED